MTYLNGDPDRPIVTGCIYNATHPVPFALPANAIVAMRAFTAQVELVHMLVQIARDPETRDVVFRENDHYLSGAMRVKGADKILSEALYVFVAQVQHNWNLKGRDPVGYALSTRDLTVSDSAPSEALDKEIAKGVVRLLMKVLQEQRFQNAVRALKGGTYPANAMVKDFNATTEYGLRRLLDNYWQPMKIGTKTQDKSKLEVPGFLEPVTTAALGSYWWKEGSATYDFGSVTRSNFRFQHDWIELVGLAGSGRVKVRDWSSKREWEEDVAPR